MLFLEDGPTYWVFGCKTCKAVGILSVQVRTKPVGWERAQYINALRGIQKAKEVRKVLGRITYFH